MVSMSLIHSTPDSVSTQPKERRHLAFPHVPGVAILLGGTCKLTVRLAVQLAVTIQWHSAPSQRLFVYGALLLSVRVWATVMEFQTLTRELAPTTLPGT